MAALRLPLEMLPYWSCNTRFKKRKIKGTRAACALAVIYVTLC